MIQEVSRSVAFGMMDCRSDPTFKFIHRLMIGYEDEAETETSHMVFGAGASECGGMRVVARGNTGNASESD